jgi:diaminopimelate decarboxylase
MTLGLRQRLKMALLRAHHRRNEALRDRLRQSAGIAPSEWGARFDDAGELEIDGCNVASLAREFGTPLHVVSSARLKADFDEFAGSFRRLHPRIEVAYSYKTNPLPGVLAELHRLGALAEVISHFELWLALRLGVPPERILFNGPAKTAAAIDLAVSRGVLLINVDSLPEIDEIAAAAARAGRRQLTGVRIVTSVGWSGQFGLSLASGDAFEAFRRVRSYPQLAASGIHFHLGTGIRDVEIYLRALREMLLFSERLRKELDVHVSHFNLGGGFGVPTVQPFSEWDQRLIANGMPPGPIDIEAAMRPADYSQRIVELLNEYHRRPPDESAPTIYFEPGRALTSRAQCLVLNVIAVKESVGERPKVILDGGKNIAMPTGYEAHELLPVTGGTAERDCSIDFFGPLCHPADQLFIAKRFRRLAPGELVAIMDAGAYFVPNQMNFSHVRPAVVMTRSGRHELLRERETFDDIVSRDRTTTRQLHDGNLAVGT